jgi:hypothetical protein
MNLTAGLRRRTRVLAVTVVAAATTLVTAGPAHASDWGGDGDPTTCSNVITVKTAPIYGSRGPTAGKQIGELQLRWSWGCSGNWSRVVLWGGMYSSQVTVEQSVSAEGRSAGATNYVYTGSGGTSAWTPYVRLANSSSTACVSATLSSDFDTLVFHSNGASFCSH